MLQSKFRTNKSYKPFIAVFAILLLALLSLGSVAAAPPNITMITPSSGLFTGNFTVNLTTDIPANCTVNIQYATNGTSVLNMSSLTGEGTTNHSILINYSDFPHGLQYNLNTTCFSPTDESVYSTNLTPFTAEYACGDNVTSDWTLQSDLLECTSGLTFDASNIVFDCGGYKINTSEGDGLTVNGNNVTIRNCVLETDKDSGVYLNGINGVVTNVSITTDSGWGVLIDGQNSTFLNSSITVTSDGWGVELGGSGLEVRNVTITASDGYGLYLAGGDVFVTGLTALGSATAIEISADWDNITVVNSSINGSSADILVDASFAPTNLLIDRNYYGNTACPLLLYGRDISISNGGPGDVPGISDANPVDSPGAATASINCSDQTVAEGFNGGIVYDGDGESTLANMTGHTTYYQSGTVYPLTSATWLPNDNYPWRYYQTYFYPGDQIVFDVNITPPNFAFSSFGIDDFENTFNSTTVTITNMTGPNGTNGTYRVNITDYTFNDTNEYINGSNVPRIINFMFYTLDTAGNYRGIWINALYNFTPQDVIDTLGGATTNWNSIADMSDVPDLTLDVPNGGKIVFAESVDLTDPAFVAALENLALLINITNSSIGLDSAELAALNKSANITFYNVSDYFGVNTTELNATYILTKLAHDGDVCTSPQCTGESYDNDTDAFSVLVSSWSDYEFDITPPTISSSGPNTEQSSTSVTLTATTNEAATCRYSTAAGDTYANMTGTFTGAALSHTKSLTLTAGESYSYYVRCADTIGNAMSSSTTLSFSVAAAGGSSGGGSSGGGITSGQYLSRTQQRVTLTKYGSFFFQVTGDAERHSVRVREINTDSVTFTVASTPQDVTVKVGESVDVDVSDDGIPDLVLELESISTNNVMVLVSRYDKEVDPLVPVENAEDVSDVVVPTTPEPIETVDAEVVEEVAPVADASTPDEAEDESSGIAWWIWLIVGLLLLVILFFVFRKPPEEPSYGHGGLDNLQKELNHEPAHGHESRTHTDDPYKIHR